MSLSLTSVENTFVLPFVRNFASTSDSQGRAFHDVQQLDFQFFQFLVSRRTSRKYSLGMISGS